jgi:hypothetical protein
MFSYVVPANVFADVDAGDSLTLSATLADGSELPAWLIFDPDTRTLSGTPANGDVGTLDIKLTASDGSNASVSNVFKLNVTNTNDAPTVAHAIGDQAATEDTPFSFTVPGDTFADVDMGDSMTLSATLANGDALPSWLHFDAATGTFSGIPTNGDVGALDVRVTGRDVVGASVSSSFQLAVVNTNDAPTTANPVADQITTEGEAFSMVVPTNTFSDVDAGDALTYSARLQNGDPLPSWLHFDAATRTLSGTAGSAGSWDVQIVATDLSGASAFDVFSVTVNPTAMATTPSPAARAPTCCPGAMATTRSTSPRTRSGRRPSAPMPAARMNREPRTRST